MGSASCGAWHCLKPEECRVFSSINRAPLVLGRRSGGRWGWLELELCLLQQGLVSGSGSGQNGFDRGNHSTRSCTLSLQLCPIVVKGLSVIMELGKVKKTSLILLSLRIHQEGAVRQIWRMLSSQLSHYKTDTMFHFLFCYRVVFLVIYSAAYLGH